MRCGFAGAVLVVGVLAGCGGGGGESRPEGTVSGTVVLDGQPVTTGRVVLISDALGASAAANLDEDGAFAIDGPVPAGEYQVFLAPPDRGNEPPGLTPEPPAAQVLTGVPEKYLSQSSTDLNVTVSEGRNEIPLVLSGR